MLILGLLLLVASGALTVGLLTSTTASVTVKVFGQTYDKVPIGELFVIGLCTGVVAIAGLVMFFSGMRRSSRKRKARRQELGANRSREGELQDENARLARELAQQRRSGVSPPPPAMPSGPTSSVPPATQSSRSGPPAGPASSPPSTSSSPPASGPSHPDRTTARGSPTTPSSSETPETRP